MSIVKQTVLFVFLFFYGCCASLPPESVELSRSVGDMITGAKVSHVNLVNRHFDQLRTEVDRFILTDYKDAFIANIRRLMSERDPEFIELSFDQYDRAVERILRTRLEWLEDVENNRRQVLQAVEGHYALLLASNAEITSLLRSAVDVTETREQFLEQVGSRVGIPVSKITDIENKLYESTNSIRAIMDNAIKQLGG